MNNFTRNQILGQLSSMGLELPSTMPADMLEKKLDAALSLAGRIPDFSTYPIDPSELPAWTDTTSLSDAFPPGTDAKHLRIIRTLFCGDIPSALNPIRAFSDVQRTIKDIAQNYVNGHEYSYAQDEQGRSAIIFRVFGVYELNATPIISLVYEPDNSRKLYKTDAFIDARVRAGAREIVRLNCTFEEQALLRHILHLNSTRVASTYKPALKPEESRYKMSFLVPTNELDHSQIGPLVSNNGCHECGGPANPGRYCSDCKMVKYCGRNCQRMDQKKHKQFDARMKGGSWTDATFVMKPVTDGKQMAIATIPHSNGQASMSSESLDAPENVHGDNATLVKIQRPLTKPENDDENDAACMLVHDRYSTFTGHIFRKDNLELWEKAMKLMPYGSERVKVYRFAKRTGDWTLSVCLDREPFGNPVW